MHMIFSKITGGTWIIRRSNDCIIIFQIKKVDDSFWLIYILKFKGTILPWALATNVMPYQATIRNLYGRDIFTELITQIVDGKNYGDYKINPNSTFEFVKLVWSESQVQKLIIGKHMAVRHDWCFLLRDPKQILLNRV